MPFCWEGDLFEVICRKATAVGPSQNRWFLAHHSRPIRSEHVKVTNRQARYPIQKTSFGTLDFAADQDHRITDAKAVAGYPSLPEVARFQSLMTFEEANAARMIQGQAEIAPNSAGTWFQLVTVEAASGAVVGDAAIHFQKKDHRQLEIGVNLSPEHQNQEFASEAINSVLGYVFDQLKKHRAVAITDADNQDADNHAAANLFRRLGFRQEAHFVEHVWYKGAYGSEYLFALLRRKWVTRPSPPHA